ncbi:MAG: hypothetical protein JWO36_4499, partial [Myxococcales bacterium]|nr:hypothetical protein [Myxococcales bacterium]
MTDRDRIVVEVPASDSRRERIERHVFEQLAAMRSADRADAVLSDSRRPRWWIPLAGLAVVGAIAVMLVALRMDRRTQLAQSSSYVVTPVGGASRFTVGDAVIDAGSDTSVEVKQEASGVVTLVLARGSVDCDVTPRPGRPPFFVKAGDITVEVVGTRFTVARGNAGVRVDVSRGKVRVASTDGERFVTAGDTWTNAITGVAPSEPQRQPATGDAAPDEPIATRPTEPARSTYDTFQAAQRLEARDRDSAARGYRKAATGSDQWAALALYSLAQLDAARGHTKTALAGIEEYQRRFGKG